MADFDSLMSDSDLPSGPDLEGVTAPETSLDTHPAVIQETGGLEVSSDDGSEPVVKVSSANKEVQEATEPDSEPKVEVADEDAPAPTPEKPKGKQYTFKVGDTPVALDENAIVEHKVDGKLEKIAVKDLITQYAGKVAIDKRFSELDRSRKQEAARVSEFENTRNRHASLITDMHANVSKGKIFDAVANMLEMSGIKTDPREFVTSMRTKMIEQATALANMTPEQRAVFEQTERNDYLQAKYDRLQQQRAQEQAQVAFQGRVAKALETANADMQTYVDTKQELERAFEQKKWDKNQITPEYISNYIRDERVFKTAQEALNDVDPNLLKADDGDKVWDAAAFHLRQNPNWTKEDLVEVLKKAFDTKRGASVSKKVQKAPVATVVAAAQNAKMAPQSKQAKMRQLRATQDPAAYRELPPEAFDVFS